MTSKFINLLYKIKMGNQAKQSKESPVEEQYGRYKYKVVKLQKLKKKDQIGTKPTQINSIIMNMTKPHKDQNENEYEHIRRKVKNNQSIQQDIYCYKDTGADKNRVMGEYNNFFSAFFHPYTTHGNIFLVPDDIWLMISLYLSKYIDDNAKRLRHHFVKHEGQKKLTIVEYANTLQESQKLEKEWDFFFQQIIKQIQKYTVQGVVEALSCNFTTTDETYKLISTAVIMSSFKKYFSYQRCIMGCGINNIYFAGTREDWVKVQSKLKFLEKYDVDGQLKKYVASVGVILENFISTFDEKPNLKWWNTIMTSEERRVGSGVSTKTYIEGWILHFYGIYGHVQAGEIPKTLIDVPIILVNKFTKKQKNLQLIADFVSVSKINQTTYKPDIGICIIEQGRNYFE